MISKDSDGRTENLTPSLHSNSNTCGYDANGNMTTHHIVAPKRQKDFGLAYDAENRLAVVTGGSTTNFYCHADGKQMETVVDGRNLAQVGESIQAGVEDGSVTGFGLLKWSNSNKYKLYDSHGDVSQDDLSLRNGWNRASDGKGIVGFPKVLDSKSEVHVAGALIGAVLVPSLIPVVGLCFYLVEVFSGADSVPVYMPQNPVR
jgi:hypothetical protein